MASIGDLVHQTSSSTGTGNLTLASVNGKRTFASVFGTGAPTDVFYYYVSNRNAAEWEWGTGHMSDSTTLVRDTIITSSNSNSAVSFSAGTLDVVNDLPAAVQALIHYLSSNGIIARTAADTIAARTITGPAAGISVSNGDGASGNPTLALANDLSALEGLASTGIAVRTGTDAWAQRTITGTTNDITVTNGDGVSGNPTIDLTSAILKALAVLSNASGYLNNNGSGTLSWSTPAAGMTSLGTKATTSGSTASLTGLSLGSYSFLICVLNGIKQSGAGNASVNQNGTAISPSMSSSATLNGILLIDLASGIGIAITSTGTAAAYELATGLSTSSTSFTLTVSTNTFSAGSFQLFGI
jgi:hypothetical protein